MDGDRDLRIIWRPESEHSIARFRRPNSTFDRDDRGQFAGSPMAVSGMIFGMAFGPHLGDYPGPERHYRHDRNQAIPPIRMTILWGFFPGF